MKYLLFAFFLTFISIPSQAQKHPPKNVQVVDTVKLDKLESEISLLKLSHDSILAQNETLKTELKEHRGKELLLSDLLSINTSWFVAIIGLIGVLIGLFTWAKYNKLESLVDEKNQATLISFDEKNRTTLASVDEKINEFKYEMYHLKMQLLSISIRVLQKDITDYARPVGAMRRAKEDDIDGWINTIIFHLIFISDRILSAKEFGEEISIGSIQTYADEIKSVVGVLYEDRDKISTLPGSFTNDIDQIKERSKVFNNLNVSSGITQVASLLYQIKERLQQQRE